MGKTTLTWEYDGLAGEGFKIYRADSPMDPENLPLPIATVGIEDREYVDETVVDDATYYYMVASYAGGTERLSGQIKHIAEDAGDLHWDKVVSLLHLDEGLTDERGAVWTSVSPSFVPAPTGFGDQFYPNLVGYATTPAATAFNLSSAEFTLEMFHTPVGAEGQETVLSTRTANGGWEMRADRGGELNFLSAGRDWSPAATGTHILPSGRSHLAICRYADGTAKAFVNGQVVHTWTSAQNPVPTSAPLTLGRGAYSSFLRPSDSYIDEVRITNGVARYTGNFTPPTKPFPNFGPALPDPHWDKVVALLHFDGGFTDETGRVWGQTGEFLTSEDEKVFGSASAYFPPTGLRGLTTPSTPDLNLGSDDFTVECWINPRIRNRQLNICGLYGHSYNRRSWDFLFETSSGGRLYFRMDDNGSAPATVVASAVMGTGMLNKWTHVAVTRDGNVFRMFFDGVIVSQGTYSISAFENLIDPVVFGTSGPDIVNSWDGHIDELRITKGVARYTENFVPSLEPFPNFGPL